jgi:hypothetical protein
MNPYLAHGLIWGSLVGGVLVVRWWNHPRRVARRVARALIADPWGDGEEHRVSPSMTYRQAMAVMDALGSRGYDALLVGPWPDDRSKRSGWTVRAYHSPDRPKTARLMLLRDEAREGVHRSAHAQEGRR